jgi:hypothetical protein
MAALANELHGMGLKFGMYSSAGEVGLRSQGLHVSGLSI